MATANQIKGLKVKPAGQSFLYLEVVDELRKRIVTGEYEVGSAIPSLATLVRAFGVSPITIRRALHTLMFEGLLYGRQGRGVFVADRKQIVRVLTSSVGSPLGNDILRAGYTPRIEEVSYAAVKASQHAITHLRKKTTIYRHEKRIFADKVPIAIDVVFLPAAVAKLMQPQLKTKFVFGLLDLLPNPVVRADFECSSTFATSHEVEVLNVVSRSPLVVANYVLYDKDDQPVFEGYTVARSERMRFAMSTRIQGSKQVS